MIALTIPSIQIGKARIREIAGEVNSISGPVTEIAVNPIYLEVLLPEQLEIELPVPDGRAALAYVFEGVAIFGINEY